MVVTPHNVLCWRHDQLTGPSQEADSFKRLKWEDTLRPLSPDTTTRRSVKRPHNDRRPRPFSHSPDRKFSSTVSSRLKQKDDIKYEAKQRRTRRVSCPPTPSPAPAPARPRPQVRAEPPKPVLKKRSSSAPRVRLTTPSPPPEPPVDYERSKLSSRSSGGSNRSKKKMRRSRRESMSSYSSSNTWTKVYPGCLAM